MAVDDLCDLVGLSVAAQIFVDFDPFAVGDVVEAHVSEGPADD